MLLKRHGQCFIYTSNDQIYLIVKLHEQSFSYGGRGVSYSSFIFIDPKYHIFICFVVVETKNDR